MDRFVFICLVLQPFSRYLNKLPGTKIAPDSLITLPAQFQICPGLYFSPAEIRHVIGTKFQPPYRAEIRHVSDVSLARRRTV